MRIRTPFVFVLMALLCTAGCLAQKVDPGTVGGTGAENDPTTAVMGGERSDVPAEEGSSAASAGSTAAANRDGVLGPRVDIEKAGQEMALVLRAFYGADVRPFSPRISRFIELPGDGLLDLPLLIEYFDDGEGKGWTTSRPGLQVRLLHTYENVSRYRDTLTLERQPAGHNVLLKGLDLRSGGALKIFIADPRPDGQTPTADFSTAFAELPGGEAVLLEIPLFPVGSLLLRKTTGVYHLEPQIFHLENKNEPLPVIIEPKNEPLPFHPRR